MSSSYPLHGDTSGALCLRCGMTVSKNRYCTHCGYSNDVMQATIPEQETQPSSALPASLEDLTLQPTQKLEQYYKQSQNLSPRSSQQPISSLHTTPSATPFLGIGPNVSFSAYHSVQRIPSSSSYSTQPTLIVPAPLPKRRSSDESDLKQISQYKNVKSRVLIIISIVVLMIGGLASYLFVYMPVIQKSVWKSVAVSTPLPKGSSEFVETFRDNSNQWDLRSETGKYSVAIANGSLVLEDDNNSLLPELLPGKRSFNNFKMKVDAVLSKGDQKNGYGVYIRCSPDQNGNPATYYRFELYGDSTYAIFKGIVDKYGKSDPSPRKLVSYATSPAIQKQGDRNHIEVGAKGDTITIQVNGQELKTFSDASYAKGTLALFISNIQNAPSGAQAKFSNLVIYPS